MAIDPSSIDNTVHKKPSFNGEGMGWLLPLLLLVLTGGLLLYFMRSSDGNKPAIASQFVAADDTDTLIKPPVIVQTGSSAKDEVQLKLRDTTITVIKGSIEYRLALYISSGKSEDSVSKNRWFEFDALEFKNNTAVLTDSSMLQIQNVAAIIKEYPPIKIKIGCYANDTNNDAANLELSRTRANTVADKLKKFGVKQTQIVAAEGFGSQNTKGGAAEMRIKRTSVVINVAAK